MKINKDVKFAKRYSNEILLITWKNMELNHGMEVPPETYCPNEVLKKKLKYPL
jgi:hypothetical protein